MRVTQPRKTGLCWRLADIPQLEIIPKAPSESEEQWVSPLFQLGFNERRHFILRMEE